jgi:hypothetical protein
MGLNQVNTEAQNGERIKHYHQDTVLLVSTCQNRPNNMYEDARQLPWLECLDNILKNMSTRLSTLREENENKVGVVLYVGAIIQERWITLSTNVNYSIRTK